MATDHREVTHGLLVIFVLFQGPFEAFTTSSQIVLFPVDMTKGVPSLLLCGLELNGLGEVLFGLLGVLGHEVEDFTTEVEQLSFLFLFVLIFDRLGIE